MAKISVLLVDDSPVFLEETIAWLSQQEGLEIVGSATSAVEGMALASRLHPRVVLMDIDMPDICGIEATRRVKSRPAAPAVVVLTLYGDPDYRAAAAEAGADGFVSKSDLASELLPCLRRVCSEDDRAEVGP
jgi:DNA-binding NarL/FixJ family response regulator